MISQVGFNYPNFIKNTNSTANIQYKNVVPVNTQTTEPQAPCNHFYFTPALSGISFGEAYSEGIERTPDRHGIVPLMNYREYCREFEKIEFLSKRKNNYKVILDERTEFPIISVRENPDFPDEIDRVHKGLRGLLPYCGNLDISHDINLYLKQKNDIYMPMVKAGTDTDFIDSPEFNQLIYFDSETIKSFIKCLDFSIEQCNRRYGIHEGLVYRGGLFSADGGMYYSTSARPCSTNIAAQINDPSKHQFHIIKTKHGVKIHEFQNEFNNNAWFFEEEILLPRDTKYRELTDTSEFEKEKLAFAEKILHQYKDRNNYSIKHGLEPEYTESISEILEKIHVWEEI